MIVAQFMSNISLTDVFFNDLPNFSISPLSLLRLLSATPLRHSELPHYGEQCASALLKTRCHAQSRRPHDFQSAHWSLDATDAALTKL